MTNPDFDPTWLLDMAKYSEDLSKKTIRLLVEVHREEATEMERERIIKLLVEADTRRLTDEQINGWLFAVKLIKGEQK